MKCHVNKSAAVLLDFGVERVAVTRLKICFSLFL